MEERELGGFGFLAGGWPLDAEKSTIIFLHGAGGSSHFWKAQVEGLAERVTTAEVVTTGKI
jgi:pimeloyl-ACP methyl ester carboxylesterase